MVFDFLISGTCSVLNFKLPANGPKEITHEMI